MILIIDNYDSFSYNLYQMIGETGTDLKVIRNDEMTVEEIRQLMPECIILSPGPGRPEDAGILIEVVKELGKEIPILGVCLGHQAVCAAFGAKITYAKKANARKAVSDKKSIPKRCCFQAAHRAFWLQDISSLAADADTIPDSLYVTASTKDGEIMAVQHKEYPIYSVQFHPESIMTPEGRQILRNFIQGASCIIQI